MSGVNVVMNVSLFFELLQTISTVKDINQYMLHFIVLLVLKTKVLAYHGVLDLLIWSSVQPLDSVHFANVWKLTEKKLKICHLLCHLRELSCKQGEKKNMMRKTLTGGAFKDTLTHHRFDWQMATFLVQETKKNVCSLHSVTKRLYIVSVTPLMSFYYCGHCC